MSPDQTNETRDCSDLGISTVADVAFIRISSVFVVSMRWRRQTCFSEVFETLSYTDPAPPDAETSQMQSLLPFTSILSKYITMRQNGAEPAINTIEHKSAYGLMSNYGVVNFWVQS